MGIRVNMTPRSGAENLYEDIIGAKEAEDMDEPAEVEQSSWRPRDLTSVLEGSWAPPQPIVGKRSDGRGLFYAAKAHTVVSETEGGKTHFALSACMDEMAAGHHTVYIDFEDDEGSLTGRLLTFGCARETIRAQFHYIRPESSLLEGRGAAVLVDVLAELRPTLAVVDGVTEAMSMHGLDPIKNQDAALFGRMLTKRLTDSGAAAVSLDHVTKDRENRGRYAIGAVHKLNGLSGAAYILTNRQPFGVRLTGRSTITIAKDRPGQLRSNALPGSGGHWYGDLVLKSEGEDYAEVGVEPPHERDENFRPTIYMQRVSDVLAEKGPLAQRIICEVVTGKAATIRSALSFLIADGFVSDRSPHTLLKPYDHEDVTT